MSVLFINACLRGEESRTLRLCKAYLDGIEDVKEVDLAKLRLEPFYGEQVAARAELEENDSYDDPMFDLSKEFAEADEIVIGAPYWDMSFPAALKIYIEHISVMGVTFHYTDEGRCEGLSRAKHLTYITSCGGSVDGANFGYEYICGIAEMFGVPETRLVAAQNLDVVGFDVEAELERAEKTIEKFKSSR